MWNVVLCALWRRPREVGLPGFPNLDTLGQTRPNLLYKRKTNELNSVSGETGVYIDHSTIIDAHAGVTPIRGK